MKHFLIVFFFLFIPALAQPIPTENPREVWVKGRLLSHGWRDGRIVVPTSQLAPLLNIQSDKLELDLLDALQSKGGYITSITDGKFEAKRDPSLYSQSHNASAARAHNKRVGRALDAAKRRQDAQAAAQPKLTYQVQRFVAETGFVRAIIRVTNAGGSTSEPHTMIADFTDGYDKPFARDTKPVGPLEPGTYQDFEVFSMIRDEETVANGVIRTVNNEKVSVRFVPLK